MGRRRRRGIVGLAAGRACRGLSALQCWRGSANDARLSCRLRRRGGMGIPQPTDDVYPTTDREAAQFYPLVLLAILVVALTLLGTVALRTFGDTAYIACAVA